MTWSGRKVTRARAYWSSRLPLPCRRCGRVVLRSHRWHVGHIIDLALGGSETDPANQWPEHGACNEQAGGRLGAARRNARRPVVVARVVAAADRRIRGW